MSLSLSIFLVATDATLLRISLLHSTNHASYKPQLPVVARFVLLGSFPSSYYARTRKSDKIQMHNDKHKKKKKKKKGKPENNEVDKIKFIND